MSDLYGVFYGQINQNSAQVLIRHLSRAVEHKTSHVHLMLHSTGGLLSDGIGLYKYLKTYPLELSIYNASYVQSAAVTLYLGAKNRLVSKGGSFMIHRAYVDGSLMLKQTEESLQKILQTLKTQNDAIASIIVEATSIPKPDFVQLGVDELWYSANQAVKCGISSAIGDFLPPKGTHVENFF